MDVNNYSPRRPSWFARVVFALGLAVSMAAPAAVDKIVVEVQVRDDRGEAVSHATVWGWAQPCSSIEPHAPTCLEEVDVLRLAQRLRATFDFVSVANKPLEDLLVPTAADGKGRFAEETSYGAIAGNPRVPPDELRFGYVFIKRGYKPVAVSFVARSRNERFKASVTLERDPSEPRSGASYEAEFERLRYELSDLHANTQMTTGGQDRIARIRSELEQTGRQALEANDRAAAARIYWRLAWMPHLRVIDQRIAGYELEALDSALLQKAVHLDGENPLLKGFDFLARARSFVKDRKIETMNADELTAYKAFEEEFRQWAYANREKTWPRFLMQPYVGYKNLRDWEQAYQWIKQTERLEPKYIAYESRVRSLKADMRLRKVPIPAHWK